MPPQRQQMIEAMILAGLSTETQAAYFRAVWQLAKYYRRAPDQLSEAEVRAYLLDLRQRGVARGTFEIASAGLRFFFCQTLGRASDPFGGKKDRPAAAEAAGQVAADHRPAATFAGTPPRISRRRRPRGQPKAGGGFAYRLTTPGCRHGPVPPDRRPHRAISPAHRAGQTSDRNTSNNAASAIRGSSAATSYIQNEADQ